MSTRAKPIGNIANITGDLFHILSGLFYCIVIPYDEDIRKYEGLPSNWLFVRPPFRSNFEQSLQAF